MTFVKVCGITCSADAQAAVAAGADALGFKPGYVQIALGGWPTQVACGAQRATERE